MKVQIALALSHNAKLIIMDEPTAGLDPIVRRETLKYCVSTETEQIAQFYTQHI